MITCERFKKIIYYVVSNMGDATDGERNNTFAMEWNENVAKLNATATIKVRDLINNTMTIIVPDNARPRWKF